MQNARMRILVVEQDDQIRELLAEILESNGFHVLSSDHCMDPEDVRQLRAGAMLIDPFMSGTGRPQGWHYLRLLKAQPGFGSFPIVLCTSAHEQLRDASYAELDLIAGALLKPFDIEELLEAVSSAAGSRPPASPFAWLAREENLVADASD